MNLKIETLAEYDQHEGPFCRLIDATRPLLPEDSVLAWDTDQGWGELIAMFFASKHGLRGDPLKKAAQGLMTGLRGIHEYQEAWTQGTQAEYQALKEAYDALLDWFCSYDPNTISPSIDTLREKQKLYLEKKRAYEAVCKDKK